jgi:hypothetical protein
MDYERLPNFFIIGAAKAGTSALYDILKQHPEVHLPFVKEPMFFSHDDNYSRGVKWYRKTYFEGAKVCRARGDVTPHYLYWAEKVAPRIHKTYGRKPPKFIVILRDPVERAYSWYWNMIKEEQETEPFETALELEAERMERYGSELRRTGSMKYGYYRGGCYADQLQHYMRYYSDERFFFLRQEDLKWKFNGTIAAVLDFLQVDTHVPLRPTTSNPASLPRSRALHKLIRRPSRLKKIMKPVIPGELRHWMNVRIMNLNLRPISYPPMSQDVRGTLMERYRDQINRLERVTRLTVVNKDN